MGLNLKKLEDLLQGSGVDYRENRVSWVLTCPRCSKKDKVYLRKKDGRFICWYCATVNGYQGRPEYLLKDLLNRSVCDLQEVLYGASFNAADGTGVEPIVFTDFFSEQEEIPEDLLNFLPLIPPPTFLSLDRPGAAKGAAYLAARGIPIQASNFYRLRYCPEERRVIFPIEVGGVCVGWQARTIDATEVWSEERQRTFRRIKVLTKCGAHVRERALMFQDRMSVGHAVLCEGPVDAIKAHMAGGNVAAMGKSVSEYQIETILRAGVKKIFLALDPDAAAEITRLCRRVSTSAEVFMMKVSPDTQVPVDFSDLSKGVRPAEDFGDMSFKQVRDCFLNAKKIVSSLTFIAPATDFFSVSR